VSRVNKALVRTLYRSCISAARRLQRGRVDSALSNEAADACPCAGGRPRATSDEDAPALVRKAFRLPLCAAVPLQQRLDAGFNAVQMVRANCGLLHGCALAHSACWHGRYWRGPDTMVVS
jgi:hypothetical protein